ncbi:hypothetical protein ABLE68_14060 [Nocardioides sp. CN2-186]|uniref:hypothetical protein n=1 Tax=Nocardioides tweenelious TaxID=3156607 RepID=UPI0032B4F43A
MSGREKTSDCTADVTLTGDVKATWSGEATSATSKGRGASYSTSSKDSATTVSVLPKEQDFPATVTVSADGATYTSQTGDGIKADKKGTGATADADAVTLVDGKQKTVHVVAEFDC